MGRGGTNFFVLFILGTIAGKLLDCVIFHILLVTIGITFIICFNLYFKLKASTNNYKFSYIFKLSSFLCVFLCGICNYQCISLIENFSILNNIASISENKRNLLISYLPKNINNEELNILKALVLGDRKDISKNIIEAYRLSGSLHLLALSGLHVSILYSVLNIALSIFNISYKTKYINFYFYAIIICSYSFITGMSPSVLRAALMIIVYKICSITNKNSNKINTLSISAFIIVLLSPKQLFSIGFQLSFSAMLGITYILPSLNASVKILAKPTLNKINSNNNKLANNTLKLINKLVQIIIDSINISVACQIATLPICYYYFSYSAPYFLISNIIAIPLVTIILYLFCLSILFYPLPTLYNLACYILEYFIHFLNSCIKFIAY